MDRKAVLRDDPKLFTYRWTFVSFLITPPLIIWWKEPHHNFLQSYRDFMLMGLSWPLLLLLALYFFRRRFLVRLVERGREIRGVVKAMRRMETGKMSADSGKAQVAIRIDGEEKLVDIDVPRSVKPNAEVTVLVDPQNLRHAVLVAQASSLL